MVPSTHFTYTMYTYIRIHSARNTTTDKRGIFMGVGEGGGGEVDGGKSYKKATKM